MIFYLKLKPIFSKGRWIIRHFRKRFKAPIKKQEKFRVNQNIIAPEVRVIEENGNMLGVMNPREALETAQQRGFDLVEIAPKANPPTCKIMDYGKWKFDLKKKEKTAKKNQTKVVIKEIQVRPRTDEFDLNVKIRKAREFLISGYKVKLHLRFSGREMAHKNIGLEMVERVTQRLKDLCAEETEKPKMERRSVFTLFSPDPAKVKEFEKKNPPPEKQASSSQDKKDKTNEKLS